ncbi:uncharacterized protein LOC110026092 [Phalaenopsis equestris]|uniref:uncharacterized protein LOC110026092 n=1 Tax=Phalaenopsis equestris TaxID=78828 RepID=UPI0009E2CA2A|nr:uncharacterized protein LOC110026092 [Phalaenopsis equestris]XP_020582555.1 uncharacterized protein LOC110026092 [Phalaenopsis equestris]
MVGIKAIFWAFALLAPQLHNVYSSSATVPAFLWSRFNHGPSQDSAKETVNYQTISPNNLAKFVLSEGGWSSFMCPGENHHQNFDVALVFVGKELQSSDISRSKHEDPTLIGLLKQSFKSSNVSMAFPYIAVSNEKDTIENSLISGFIDSCGHDFGVKNIAYMESCSLKGQNFKKLEGLRSLQDFISGKMESGVTELTDLIVFCGESSEESIHTESEGQVLSEIVDLLEKSGSTYTILYASDPYRSYPYPSLSTMRFLSESNSSSNSTRCDGVCQLKSSLLEGLFVGIVLLIILISGLCCMTGIDTPTRFEAAPES